MTIAFNMMGALRIMGRLEAHRIQATVRELCVSGVTIASHGQLVCSATVVP